MAIGAQTDVVCQVEAVVVRIFVNYDLIGAPVPVVAEAVIDGEDAEGEAAEPEAFAIAAFNTPDVLGTEAASEVAVGPGMIDVIVRIIGARIVANPFSVGVDMRGVGMTGFVDIIGSRSGMSLGLGRGRTMGRGVRRRRSWRVLFLREYRNRTDQEQCKNS